MKELEKYITDEKTGLKYELVGDYYYLAGDDEPGRRNRSKRTNIHITT